MTDKKCSVCGSDKWVYFNRRYGDFLCGRHAAQMNRNNKIFGRTIFDSNEIIIGNDFAEIVLYNKNCDVIATTKIDIDDIEKVKGFKWSLSARGDVVSQTNRKHTKLHRLLMDPPNNKQIDHINWDRLDNRKKNLRIVTDQQNSFNLPMQSNNTSGATGVSWDKSRKKWAVEIHCNYKKKHLGRFNNKNDAIKAYQESKEKYHKVIKI